MSQTVDAFVVPSDRELQILRDQISDTKRAVKYAKLKNKLKDIVSQ